MNNQIKRNIKFGTDGWRAIIADEFTFENLSIVINAIGNYLKNKNLEKNGIFIGYDNRFLSEEFAKYSAKLLEKRGLKIFLSDTSVPTPLTAFMAVDMNLDGAIMITASHNPPIYNGIKFIPSYGGPADDSITKEIEINIKYLSESGFKKLSILGIETVKYKNTNNSEGNLKIISEFKSYKELLLKSINKNLISEVKPKVAVDTMFGAGSKIFPEILIDDLKLEPKVFNNWRDTLFGGKLPDPSKNNLKELRDFVLKNKYDMGIALDGDADRFGIIDGKGVFINPNNVISLILYYLVKSKRFNTGEKAVRTVATTHLIDEICFDNSLGVLETPVGFKYICREMLKGNVIIGGEESGGLSIKGHIPEKDGLLAGLILIEIQSYLKKINTNTYLSDYLNKIYDEFGVFYNTRLDIEIPEEKKDEVIKYFYKPKSKNILNIKITDIIDRDGAKVILENKSWILVRPSGTEPLIRCYIESTDKNCFEKMQNYVKSKINELKNQIK